MIEPGYAHLLINHFPVVLALVGALGALLALAMRRRSVWLFAVACITLAGVTAQPVVMTGEVAADAMRTAWYLTRGAVRAHGAAGEWARWALLLAGVVSAFAWWTLVRAPRTTAQQRDGRTGDFPGWLRALVVATALLSVAATTRAAWLGAKLVHMNATLAAPPGTPAPGPTPAAAPRADTTPAPAAPSALPGPGPFDPDTATAAQPGGRARGARP